MEQKIRYITLTIKKIKNPVALRYYKTKRIYKNCQNLSKLKTNKIIKVVDNGDTGINWYKIFHIIHIIRLVRISLNINLNKIFWSCDNKNIVKNKYQ